MLQTCTNDDDDDDVHVLPYHSGYNVTKTSSSSNQYLNPNLILKGTLACLLNPPPIPSSKSTQTNSWNSFFNLLIHILYLGLDMLLCHCLCIVVDALFILRIGICQS